MQQNILRLFFFIISCGVVYFLALEIKPAIQFAKERSVRYKKGVNKLVLITNLESHYMRRHGHYTENIDSLKYFVDSTNFYVIKKVDSTYRKLNIDTNIVELRNKIVSDTIKVVRVKDSISEKKIDWLKLPFLPVGEKTAKITIKTGLVSLKKNNEIIKVSTFEAYMVKKQLLKGLIPSMIAEDDAMSTQKLIQIGNLKKQTLDANWHDWYDDAPKINSGL